MDGGGSESLTLQAWLENSESSDNANEGNRVDHADSGPINSTGQTHWHVSDNWKAVQGDEVGDGGEKPRSELPKGFYEVEAIRSQWMREDIQTENMIKWLERPNAANSWDPLKNLRNMPDLSDAFEERIRSTNQSRCKDKHGNQNTQPEWLHRLITPCNLRGNQQQSTSCGDVNHADVDALPQDDDIPILPIRETLNSNKNISTASPTVGIFNDFQQWRIFKNSNESTAFYGSSMVNSGEPVQNERPKGAKKRKLGPVKRFIKVPLEFEPTEQASAAVANSRDNNGNINLETVDQNNLDIVKIIGPIDFVPPRETTTGESFITFLVLRSNGEETLVSNRDLRASNPKLLFKYYEQNLSVP